MQDWRRERGDPERRSSQSATPPRRPPADDISGGDRPSGDRLFGGGELRPPRSPAPAAGMANRIPPPNQPPRRREADDPAAPAAKKSARRGSAKAPRPSGKAAKKAGRRKAARARAAGSAAASPLPASPPGYENAAGATGRSRPTPAPRGAAAGGRPPRGPSSGKRTAGRAGKTALALVSAAVFGLTAFAWITIAQFNDSLTTTDVIGAGNAEHPADGAVDILLVGMDSRTDAQGNPLPNNLLARLHAGEADGELNTDTLILVHIPSDGRAATAVSIPRDSYVDIPGFGEHKINSAFGRAKEAAKQQLERSGDKDPRDVEVKSNQVGARSTIATVQQLTGTTIDHYAQVNLVGFYDISRAIGGVPVCLKHAVDDREYSGAVFPAGPQVVLGGKALAFVRQRHNIPGGSNDLQRNRRQQAFLAGMAHKVLSAGTLTSPSALNSLIDAVKKSIVIDQGWDITSFAEQMQNLTGGNLKFSTIPVENLDLSTPSDGTAVKVDPTEVADFIRGQVGQPPAPKPSAPTTPHWSITVDVRNGAGTPGLAGSVLKTLSSKGFTSGDTANTGSRHSTVLHYPSGAMDAAQQVAAALGGSNYQLTEDSSLPTGHVQVFLGTDYAGPGASTVSSSAKGSGTTGGATPANDTQTTTPKPPQPPLTADGTTCVD